MKTIPVWVAAWVWDIDQETSKLKDNASLHVYTTRPEPNEHMVPVGQGTATVEIPEKINLVKLQVEGVEGEIQKLKDEYFEKLRTLEERKRNLLALSWNGN